ncbi:unannotated protein [freshwater metagenome]|uniref:Unannotated protein n=1 Tax=freshwater metagenome TaxID=449393 RepID=A0A6J6JLN1_9ZZZZ
MAASVSGVFVAAAKMRNCSLARRSCVSESCGAPSRLRPSGASITTVAATASGDVGVVGAGRRKRCVTMLSRRVPFAAVASIRTGYTPDSDRTVPPSGAGHFSLSGSVSVFVEREASRMIAGVENTAFPSCSPAIVRSSRLRLVTALKRTRSTFVLAGRSPVESSTEKTPFGPTNAV